jgi:release factor glutamine methyltransferase
MAAEPAEWDVTRVLNWGTALFKQRNIDQPRISIEWILGDALGLKRFDLYLQFDRPLTPPELASVRAGVERRLTGEPLQYISGYTDFHHCKIRVTRDVLIPRPETEELVELLLKNEPQLTGEVLDMGTGSGCIPVALKKARPGWVLYGLDISDAALAVARQNAALNETEVTFFRMDIRNAPAKKPKQPLDVIVSNPPYIPSNEKHTVEAQVLHWEPGMALFCESALEFYAPVCEAAQSWLKEGGRVYLEMNDTYAEATKALFDQAGFTTALFQDLDGRNRFLKAVKKTD